jgi:hypothetical protein
MIHVTTDGWPDFLKESPIASIVHTANWNGLISGDKVGS